MSRSIEKILRETIVLAGQPQTTSESTWTPNTDVYESKESLVVTVEIAGVAPDDLSITLKERLLVVRGYRKDPCQKKPCRYRQMEIDYGYFERCIVIPCVVDGHHARAQCHNGFLHVELPKAERSSHTTVVVVIEPIL